MSQWAQIWILDREAFNERAAIMIEDGGLPIYEAHSAAADLSYRTPLALAATEAARGDWEPAKALCRKQPEGYGRDLMRAIQEAVREKQALSSPR